MHSSAPISALGLQLPACRHQAVRQPRPLCRAAKSSRDAPAETSGREDEGAAQEDTRSYPSKDMGGATGGWAGGEVGLRRYLEESEGRSSNGSKPAAAASKAPAADSKSQKGDSSSKFKPGAGKYPSKEAVGPLSGITGGFAGGERGLQQYVEKGDLNIAAERQGQFSPLLVAGFVASIVTVVALLVNQGEDAAEVQIDTKLLGQSMSALRIESFRNPAQRLVLTVAAGILGLSLTVGGARFVSRRLQSGARGARAAGVRTLTFAGFLSIVLLAAKVILDSQ